MSSPRLRQIIIWTPRVLAILFALFLSLFALDAFVDDQPFLTNLIGFLIHLAPTYFLAFIIAMGWKRSFWTGISFITAGIILSLIFDHQSVPTSMFVSRPNFVIGALFLLSHFISKPNQIAHEPKT